MENHPHKVDNFLEDPHEHIRFTRKEDMGIIHLHNDAILTTVVSGRHALKEVLIYNGSAMDIQFKRTLDIMVLDEAEVVPRKVCLCRFSGEEVISLGTIRLPITFEIEDG